MTSDEPRPSFGLAASIMKITSQLVGDPTSNARSVNARFGEISQALKTHARQAAARESSAARPERRRAGIEVGA